MSDRAGPTAELTQLYSNRQQLFKQILETSSFINEGRLSPTSLEEAKQHRASLKESHAFVQQRIESLQQASQPPPPPPPQQDQQQRQQNTSAEPGPAARLPVPCETEIEVKNPNVPYKLFQYLGGTHRLPRGWKFPSCSVFQLWRLWLLGEDGLCPLKLIRPPDLRSLDAFRQQRCGQLMEEQEGDMERRGPKHRRHHRNPMANTISQIRFVCNFIELKIRQNNAWTDTHTTASVERMFLDTEVVIIPPGKQRQMLWSAFLTALHRQGRRAKQVKHALDGMRENAVAVEAQEVDGESKENV